MMIRKYYRRILVACALVVGVGVLFYRLDHQGFFNLQKIQMDLLYIKTLTSLMNSSKSIEFSNIFSV